MDLEAMPLVRGVLEYGLTAQWMFHNEAEALAGFINEQQRQAPTTARTPQAYVPWLTSTGKPRGHRLDVHATRLQRQPSLLRH
jgi:hypothetical protein